MGVGFLAGPPLASQLAQRDAFAAAAVVLAVGAAAMAAAPAEDLALTYRSAES